MKQLIETRIVIKASAADVWETLMDFKAYPDWNPFVTKITGSAEEGSQLEINAGGMKFKPVVLSSIAEQEFVWKGKLWLSGLFDGTHGFYLEPIDGKSCRFMHREHFSGMLVGLFRKKLDVETRQGFDRHAQPLQKLLRGSQP